MPVPAWVHIPELCHRVVILAGQGKDRLNTKSGYSHGNMAFRSDSLFAWRYGRCDGRVVERPHAPLAAFVL
jgi:hypothetical protein